MSYYQTQATLIGINEANAEAEDENCEICVGTYECPDCQPLVYCDDSESLVADETTQAHGEHTMEAEELGTDLLGQIMDCFEVATRIR